LSFLAAFQGSLGGIRVLQGYGLAPKVVRQGNNRKEQNQDAAQGYPATDVTGRMQPRVPETEDGSPALNRCDCDGKPKNVKSKFHYFPETRCAR